MLYFNYLASIVRLGKVMKDLEGRMALNRLSLSQIAGVHAQQTDV